MALLPDTSADGTGGAVKIATKGIYPNRTYKMQIENDRVQGSITKDLEAVKQAVYKILNTERYKHVIYSWNYGVELNDLFGKPMPYVLPEIPRRITEALTQDDRITGVTDYDLSYTKDGAVLAKFTVVSIYGDFEEEVIVSV